jgi:hypothetical protein
MASIPLIAPCGNPPVLEIEEADGFVRRVWMPVGFDSAYGHARGREREVIFAFMPLTR